MATDPHNRVPTEPEGASGLAGPGDPDDDGAAAPPDQAEHTSHELATVIEEVRRLAPPKRTGVFLDPDDLRAHVGDLLRVMLGGYEVDAAGNFTFMHESARVFVTIGTSPVGPTVGVFSITNVDVVFTEDLARFLLTTNHRIAFGTFSYDESNRAVWLKHALLGTMLDGPELHAAVMAIASTAASVDDAIRDRFGGRTFSEAPEEVQRQAHPPETDEGPPAPNASGYL